MNVRLTHRTLREVVADELRGMIMRGELRPGERLFEDKLAEQLNVSRNPVREAIRALEGIGLVEVVPRRGAFVARLQVDQVRQLLELRSVVEAYAAERAARCCTAAHLTALQQCIDVGRAAAAENDTVTAAQCHREFHVLVTEASGNGYLENVIAPLHHQTELVFSMLTDSRSVMGWDEHQAIVDALQAGDPAAARAATAQHMDNVIRDLETRLPVTGRPTA